jgi:heme-degrading monooxygenase HmoA
MSQIVRLPKPPYYVVVAPAILSADIAGYPEMAQKLIATAPSLEGFLGIETCLQPGFAMAVSYWDSLEAIHAWRTDSAHRHAKERGKATWFDEYATRIAKVQLAY